MTDSRCQLLENKRHNLMAAARCGASDGGFRTQYDNYICVCECVRAYARYRTHTHTRAHLRRVFVVL